MKYKVFPASGGTNLDIEDLEYLQAAAKAAIEGLASVVGVSGSYILSGVVDNGTTVSDGWLLHNGELLRFKQSASSATVVIRDEEVEVGTGDKEKWTECGTGVTTIDFADLVRIEPLSGISNKIEKSGASAFSAISVGLSVLGDSWYKYQKIHSAASFEALLVLGFGDYSTQTIEVDLGLLGVFHSSANIPVRISSSLGEIEAYIKVVNKVDRTTIGIKKADGTDFTEGSYFVYISNTHLL